MSPSAGIHIPLLPGSKSTAEHGTIPGAVFNVATSIIGSGIMSIPAILKVLGVFPSFALILIVAVLAEVSVDFLMRFTDAGAKTTYAGVMKEAFGSVGALTTKVFVIINNFGGLILLLIIIVCSFARNQTPPFLFQTPPNNFTTGMSPSAGAHVPLLTGTNSAVEPGSVPGAVFNLATTIIGAGIMSIPAILKVLGVFPSFALILIVAVLAEVSVEFLLRFTHAGETTTYAGVMREAFGSYGAISVQVCVIVTNFGALILYLIIIGDVLSGKESGDEVHLGILQQWFGIHWWNSREVALLITLVLVMLPLVLYRRVESLKYSSAISTLLAVAFVAICSGLAIVALVQGKTQTPKLVPRLDYQTSFFDLFTAVPVVVTAFTFHFNVHPIGFELAKPSDMKTAVRLAIMFCAFIYFTIGLFGYLLFGDSTQSDILINFDQSSDSTVGSLCNSLIRVSYALHIMLVFPILNFSLRSNIDELLFPKKPLLATDNKRFILITLVLLVFSYLAAIAIPDIWYFFQFLGSTTALCLAFIFPGTIALRDALGISTRKDKIIALVMIILAVVTSVIAISTNIYNALSSKS